MAPQFTVIVPTYKGGEYLEQCVRSVLAQTYTNFELAVLENGNVDGSVEWLHSVGDSRLKVYPSATVLSIEHNWARALEVPKNEFITFFGHDDVMDPNYLEVMDALIRREPEAGLYFTHFRYIDENGNVIRSCQPIPARATGAEFLKAFLSSEIEVNGTGYMMRSRAYDDVGGIPRFKNLLYADHALFFMLTHDSHKVTAPQECFSYRLHPNSTSASTNQLVYLQAITSFIEFFLNFKSNNAEFNRVFEQEGPAFFSRLCVVMHLNLLVEANQDNQRLGPEKINGYVDALARISPQKADELRNSEKVRLHQFINSNRLLRLAYLSISHGKSHSNALKRWLYKLYMFLRAGRHPVE